MWIFDRFVPQSVGMMIQPSLIYADSVMVTTVTVFQDLANKQTDKQTDAAENSTSPGQVTAAHRTLYTA